MTLKWPPSLVTELAERRVVIFIGAGISKTAHSSIPSWIDLLKEMGESLSTRKDKKLVEKLIRNDRLLDAAELLNNEIEAADRRQIFERKFRISPTPISDIYSDILALDPKVLITTNYDQFIEKNFEHFSGGMSSHLVRSYTHNNLISDIRSPSRIIMKVHGCISNVSEIVLDKSSYFNAKANNTGTYDIIKALCTVNTVLFLGYSMGDPDIQLVLEEVNARIKSDHPHFALVSKFDHPSLRSANSHTYNVNFIEYAKDKHEIVPNALSELKEAVIAERASLGNRI